MDPITHTYTEGRPVEFPLFEMAQSQFCLAPTGYGWGVRLKQSLIAGCIPVVIADEIEVCSRLSTLFHLSTLALRKLLIHPY